MQHHDTYEPRESHCQECGCITEQYKVLCDDCLGDIEAFQNNLFIESELEEHYARTEEPVQYDLFAQ